MPRYTNTNDTRVMVGGTGFIDPQGTLDTNVYFPDTLPAGVTMDEAYSQFNPILLSTVISSNDTVNVPNTITSYNVRVKALNGSCNVFLNTTANTPGLRLSEGDSFTYKCFARIIHRVVINGMTGNAVLITVEKA